jgi:preprotein translocase subunit SecG
VRGLSLWRKDVDAHGDGYVRDEIEDGMQLALQIVLIVSSVLLVLLILLHRGRGGGLSSLFGGGVQSSLSGSSVVEKNLDRLTLFVAAIWVIAIIGTGLLVKIGA